MKTFPLLLVIGLLMMGCNWFKKKDDPTPLEQLPPATQEGKRTFGCLLNGQAWTPQGNTISSNYNVSFDPTYYGGTFQLKAYRYPNKGDGSFQSIGLYSDSLSKTGTYSLEKKRQSRVYFTDTKTHCEYVSYNTYDSSTTLATGSLTITRLDLSAGIISGTFEFTLAKPGCDTIKVTNGRFDRKL